MTKTQLYMTKTHLVKRCMKVAQKFRFCFGLPMLYIGVLTLLVGAMLPLDNKNTLNLSALAMIYAGAIGYIVKLKHNNKV